jgi:hypothetical protein
VGEKSYLKAVGNRPYRENEERRLVNISAAGNEERRLVNISGNEVPTNRLLRNDTTPKQHKTLRDFANFEFAL